VRVITINQKIKIIRNDDIKNMYHHLLLLEIDYELAGLSYALKRSDQQEIYQLKDRLRELTIELQRLERSY